MSRHRAEWLVRLVSKLCFHVEAQNQAHIVANFRVCGKGGREEPSCLFDTNTRLVNDARPAKAPLLKDVNPVD